MNAVRRWACVLPVLAAPLMARAETHTVVIEAMQFRPATLVLKRGDRVVWHNKDVVPHTATAEGGFDSGRMDPGQRWSWTVRGDGRIDYLCTYHPGMKGSLAVR